MSKEALKVSIGPSLEVLDQFSKKLSETIRVVRLTCNQENTNGTNGSSMDYIMELLEHEFIKGSKIRPVLNNMHKVLYKNAAANLAAKRQAENDALRSRSPKLFLPKTKKSEGDNVNEITEPDIVLNAKAG